MYRANNEIRYKLKIIQRTTVAYSSKRYPTHCIKQIARRRDNSSSSYFIPFWIEGKYRLSSLCITHFFCIQNKKKMTIRGRGGMKAHPITISGSSHTWEHVHVVYLTSHVLRCIDGFEVGNSKRNRRETVFFSTFEIIFVNSQQDIERVVIAPSCMLLLIFLVHSSSSLFMLWTILYLG